MVSFAELLAFGDGDQVVRDNASMGEGALGLLLLEHCRRITNAEHVFMTNKLKVFVNLLND